MPGRGLVMPASGLGQERLEGRARPAGALAGRVPLVAGGAPGAQVGEMQRTRVLVGMVAAVGELGYAGATVGKITARARVSRRTFYELFANRDECLAAVLEDVVAEVERELRAAGVGDLAWRERVRVGLAVILGFLDREPGLAHVCVVEALRAGAPVAVVRERVFAELVGVVDEGRSQGLRGEESSPLMAEGLVGAAFAIVHARVSRGDSRPLSGLVGELVGMIVLPYLGPAAARRERERERGYEYEPVVPAGSPGSAVAGAGSVRVSAPAAAGALAAAGDGALAALGDDPLQGVAMRLTYRTARVLEGVGELSCEGGGPSNRQIAAFAGVSDPGQMSKLLRRLERLGLLENRGVGHAHGEPNAWCLTARGVRLAQGIGVLALPGRREAA